MQKKLIAVAVAGLMSGAAFAQSNVTIYGVADATFDSIKTTGTNVEPRHNRISTNSSLIGFKGAEDLGNGLTAVFQFEGSVGFDGGAAFGGANRDSLVGIAGGFGTVAFGNLTGPTRAFGAAVDVNAGATGIAANSGIIGKFGGVLQGATTDAGGSLTTSPNGLARSSTAASPFDTRWKNAIAYISPTMGGVTVIAAYVANENKTDAVDTWGYDFGVKYAAGPVLVGLSYNKAMVNNDGAATVLALNAAGRTTVNTPSAASPLAAGTTNVALSDIAAANIRLVASFDAGVVKINGLAERVKVTGDAFGIVLAGGAANTTALGSFSETQDTYGLGVIVPVGMGKITGQYYVAREIDGIPDTDGKLMSVGYEHSLSKRTILKANYARLVNGDNASNQFGVNSNNANIGETASGFQIGVRHSF